MARRILAGVANVDMFVGDQLIATAKTLLDSSITIGSSSEDIRGGMGSQLFAKYYHTSTFDIALTDTMFKLEYIAFQTGSNINVGSDIFTDEQVVLTAGGNGTILGTPANFENYGTIGWATIAGEEEYQKITFTGNTFTFPSGNVGDIVCVKYVSNDASTREIVVSSNFIPSTVRLVMTANLFDGGGNASFDLSSATNVGQIQIEVPRFQFNGSQEISMSSSGAANTPINGSALSNVSRDCGQNGYYATIKETIFGANWYDNVIALAIEDADFDINISDTKTLVVYAIPRSGSAFVAKNDELTFTAIGSNITVGTNTGLVTGVASGTDQVNVVITNKNDVEAVASVTVN